MTPMQVASLDKALEKLHTYYMPKGLNLVQIAKFKNLCRCATDLRSARSMRERAARVRGGFFNHDLTPREMTFVANMERFFSPSVWERSIFGILLNEAKRRDSRPSQPDCQCSSCTPHTLGQ